jgi:hypothetical protein
VWARWLHPARRADVTSTAADVCRMYADAKRREVKRSYAVDVGKRDSLLSDTARHLLDRTAPRWRNWGVKRGRECKSRQPDSVGAGQPCTTPVTGTNVDDGRG